MRHSDLLSSAVIPFRLVFLMWLIFLFEVSYGLNANFLGILPRTFFGLSGVLFAPMIHGDAMHLLSNTVPVLFLGTTLFYFYGRIGQSVFLRSYFWTNLGVWVFARQTLHIGASGLVYGLAFFLIFFGIFRRDFLSLLVSIITIMLYGSVFYGILPADPRISWESHLSGAIVGIFTAVNFRNKKRVG